MNNHGKNKDTHTDDIEYGDFIFIDSTNELITKKIIFIDYLEWLMQDDFKHLEDKLQDYIGIKKVPKRSGEEVIEGIVYTSEKDFYKKTSKHDYYECSYIAIMNVIRFLYTPDIFNILCKANKDIKMSFLVDNYKCILLELLTQIEDLAALYSEKIGDHRYSSGIRTYFVPTVALHQVLRQELYGSLSFHAFADKHISASIGTIRQLVELRMRRAFGTLAFLNSKEDFVPLDMSLLFQVVKQHKGEIVFPIKLENIIRIYKWANGYIHSGIGDYPWIPMYLERILSNLSFGIREENGTWSFNNGIKMKNETLLAVQDEILNAKNTNKDGTKIKEYKLYTCKPECEILK